MCLKVGLLTNMPTAYRSGLWKEYSKSNRITIDIYYCTEIEKDRHWEVIKTDEVSETFLPGITFFGHYHFNPAIVNVFKNYDVWIIGGYSIPTCQALIILCKTFNIPYILMIDGISPKKLRNPTNRILDMLKRSYIKGQALSFANGTIGKRLMMKYGMAEDKIYNQFLSVDIDWFINMKERGAYSRSETRMNLCIKDNEITLLYVGRIIKSKGIEDIIIAMNKMQNDGIPLKLLIVGEGELREELENKYCENENVVFCGEVQYTHLYKYYYSSDIFILPTYDDPWGLVINEAMACSLPVITTTAAGAHLDLIDDPRFVYSPGNVEELVTSLKNMMGLKIREDMGCNTEDILQELSTIGSNNQLRIKGYSYSNSKAEFESMINRIKEEHIG